MGTVKDFRLFFSESTRSVLMQSFLVLFLFFPGHSEREGGYCCNEAHPFILDTELCNKNIST